MKLDGFPAYVQDYYDEVASRYDSPQLGNRVAWEAVKYRLKSTDKQIVAQRKNFMYNRLFSVALDEPDKTTVTQNDDGTYTLDAVLTSTNKDVHGKYFTEQDLHRMAEQINKHGLVAPKPDDDKHKEFDNIVVSQGFRPNAIRNTLGQDRGFLEEAKATVKEGKLWLQAKVDESMKRVAEAFDSLSLEALAHKKANGRMANPDPIGFIFTDSPKNPDAAVAK